MTSAPELYLVLQVTSEDATVAAAALKAALDAAPIASVLFAPPAGQTLPANVVKSLVALAQKRGVAALIAADASLARMLKADGLHLPFSKQPLEAYREARAILGNHAMIGADAGRSRDDAMSLGEDGADYIAFGIPAHVEDRRTAEARQCELTAWWSEIFEVPCVAFDVASTEHARALAEARADFVTVPVDDRMTAGEITERVARYAAAISLAGAPA